MALSLEQRILAARDAEDADARLADRLLECLQRIESGFRGRERARLRGLVSDALERHIEARRSHRSTLETLEKLRDDHVRIARLLELLVAPREGRTLH